MDYHTSCLTYSDPVDHRLCICVGFFVGYLLQFLGKQQPLLGCSEPEPEPEPERCSMMMMVMAGGQKKGIADD